MAEIKFRTDTYVMKMRCEKCGGEMVVDKNSGVVATNPPQYLHICSNEECKNAELYYKAYPCIEYKLLDEVIEEDDKVIEIENGESM